MTKVKHNNCFGCAVANHPDNDCDYYKSNGNEACPCTSCLVKTMCKCNTGECDPFDKWADTKDIPPY